MKPLVHMPSNKMVWFESREGYNYRDDMYRVSPLGFTYQDICAHFGVHEFEDQYYHNLILRQRRGQAFMNAIFGLNRAAYDYIVNSIYDPWESDEFNDVLRAFDAIVWIMTTPREQR